jgi:uncharacterized membrane-anchored protein YhcB (DUF1043 family)
MRICDNGIMRDATAEELAFFAEMKEKAEKELAEMQPTMEERLEKLEKLFNRIKELLEKMGVKV